MYDAVCQQRRNILCGGVGADKECDLLREVDRRSRQTSVESDPILKPRDLSIEGARVGEVKVGGKDRIPEGFVDHIRRPTRVGHGERQSDGRSVAAP
jgi:hypothetical protein